MKVLYLLGCALLAIAIITDLAAKGCFSSAAQTLARAAAFSQVERSNAEAQADHSVKVGNRFSLLGNVLAVCGLALWIASSRSPKRMTPVIPLALLASYIFLFLVLL
jgi:hypothetical protein